MFSLNRHTIMGHLGRDADIKFTQNGVPVANFSVATTHRIKRNDKWEDETTWHDVVLWRNEWMHEYLKKGARVLVEGRSQKREYQGSDGQKKYRTELIAEDISPLGMKGEGGQGASRAQGSKASKQTSNDDFGSFDDDDVPF